MTIAVIDGMGGKIGVQIVERLRREAMRDVSILALGANVVATQRMVDAGADKGATGENAIRVSVACADFIIGPVGIVLPSAMMGEITPGIAEAVFGAKGKKLLLPLSQPHMVIVGMADKSVDDLISDLVVALKKPLSEFV
jgi:hypothetical protein